MSSKIQLRRDTAANWTSTNPVLSQGEPGLETDTNKVKYGDGTTAWTSLEYASGGAGGSGDVVSDWQDGLNDNTWRIVTVSGTKELEFVTEGNRLIELTLTSDMLVDVGNGNLTFADADSALFADLWFSYDRAGAVVGLFLTNDFKQGNYSNYQNNITNPSEGVYLFNNSNGDFNSWQAGDKITIRYWSEGTTYTDSYWDTYDPLVADSTSEGPTNEITFDTNEFNWMPWSDFLINPTEHSLSFLNQGKNDFRNITNVVDNGDGTYTATFDGTAVQITTMTTEEVTFLAVDNKENSYNLTVPKDALLGLASDVLIYPNDYGTNTNKYKGGSNRSGYFTINGGEPIDFQWYWNYDGDNGNPYMNVDSGGVTYSVGDTIVFTYYTPNTKVQLDIYRPQTDNWNNGMKWFDWKTDVGAEYNAGPGNGIIGGKGTYLMKVYNQEAVGGENDSESVFCNFAWSGYGNESFQPYDAHRDNDVSNWGYDANNFYPMYDFDERGIIAYSNDRTYDWSVTFKVRIMYKFELYIGDDNYEWFC